MWLNPQKHQTQIKLIPNKAKNLSNQVIFLKKLIFFLKFILIYKKLINQERFFMHRIKLKNHLLSKIFLIHLLSKYNINKEKKVSWIIIHNLGTYNKQNQVLSNNFSYQHLFLIVNNNRNFLLLTKNDHINSNIYSTIRNNFNFYLFLFIFF